MRRIALGIFSLTIICAIAVTGSMVIGRGSSFLSWSSFLHFDECELPCWIGIQPGQTTLAEAQMQIERVYGKSILYPAEWRSRYQVGVTSSAGYYLDIALDLTDVIPESGTTVSDIHLSSFIRRGISFYLFTLADLSDVLGQPENIRLAGGAYREVQVLFYGNRRIQVWIDDTDCDRVTPRQGISSITLWGQPETQGLDWRSDYRDWRGFSECHNIPRVPMSE